MRRISAVLVLSLFIVPLLALEVLSGAPAAKWEKEPTTYRDFPFGGSIKEFEKAFHTKIDPAHSCTEVGGQAPAGVIECLGQPLPGMTGSRKHLGIPPPEVGFDVNEYFMFDET